MRIKVNTVFTKIYKASIQPISSHISWENLPSAPIELDFSLSAKPVLEVMIAKPALQTASNQ